MDLVTSPPTNEEFNKDFVSRYNESIMKSKAENYLNITKVRDALCLNKDLNVPNIDSGFSFFCSLNPNEKLLKLAFDSKKSPSEYYVDRLNDEKNILVGKGEG